MTEKTIENMLAIYDEAKDKGKAMNQICGLFGIHKDELRKILQEHGRKFKKGKPSTRENEAQTGADLSEYNSTKVAPTPKSEYVKQVLEEKVEDLSAEIAHLDENITRLESEKMQLNARIMEIHSFFNQFF